MKNFPFPNIFKKPTSVVMKVTLWYAFFIIILISIIVAISISIGSKLADNSNREDLIKYVTNFAKNPQRTQGFDEGIFFMVYDKTNNNLNGQFPLGFNPLLSFKNKVTFYTSGNKSFLYYDVPLSSDDSQWVRGVTLAHKTPKEITFFLTIVLIISPIIILFIVYGGYRIIKKSFEPVAQISSTAASIAESKDFAKRIEIKHADSGLQKLTYTFNEMLQSLENSYLNEKQFNTDVSHELRTPVSVILSETEYGIKYAENSNEMKQSLQNIQEQTKRMAILINQIMELSKIEENKKINFEKQDLSQILNIRINDYKTLIEAKNITLQKNISTQIYINANRILIERIIDNLISNAIKFTKNKININAYKDKNKIILSIQDNGIGIDPKNQKLIWNRFYQVDQSRNKEYSQGNGLGLSLVAKIVQMHKAKLLLESEPNIGSTFTIEFAEYIDKEI